MLDNDLDQYEKIFFEMKQSVPSLSGPIKKTETIPVIFNRQYDENFFSYYLAFVLNPAKNGIGLAPIKKLMSIFQMDSDLEEDCDVTIDREYMFENNRRIDILINVDDKILIGIENKLYAGEGGNQTFDYNKSLNILAEEKGMKTLKIFLSPNGIKPKNDGFHELSYKKLIERFKEIKFDYFKDIRKSFLFYELITHVEEYMDIKKNFKEFSGKTKFYLQKDTIAVIKALKDAFMEDLKQFVASIEEHTRIFFSSKGLDSEKMEFKFKTERDWQNFYKNEWAGQGFFVHFEINNIKEMLETNRNNFDFMIHVEDYKRKEFYDKFKSIYEKDDKLKEYCEKNDIQFIVNLKDNILLQKEYIFEDIIASPESFFQSYEKALEDFYFFVDYIDETINELIKK
ncbi:MAG: PD-(D/E)XK nuclease family protein [Candidatus Margulisbacteria bacterium]|nr:PD-(D/E)XK nuclease family protein [Candidatus Margulisiibacteriota bacterium]